MLKHHLQSAAEQISKTGHGSAPFHREKSQLQASEAVSENIQMEETGDDSAIKLRAYQIHQEKGGSDIDNWLEAERSLENVQVK